jgi:hypothetical protein
MDMEKLLTREKLMRSAESTDHFEGALPNSLVAKRSTLSMTFLTSASRRVRMVGSLDTFNRFVSM